MKKVICIVLIALIILLAMPAMGATIVDDEQTEFNVGTYTDTYFSPSGFIRLNEPVAVQPLEMVGDEANLIAYWRFNESSWTGATGEVRDVLGRNDGTAKGGATTTAGKFGNAGAFTGSGYIDLPSGVSSSLGGASGATVSAWVKRNSIRTRH